MRIIPARAGFTTANQISHVRVKDHPRSRGAYSTVLSRALTIPGSSPLARGLPAQGSAAANDAPDHPRSRGVYNENGDIPSVGQGSSPLARGLRNNILRNHLTDWIIPARAGFTATKTAAKPQNRDHPRSRGVYKGGLTTRRFASGSSPLARGLPVLSRSLKMCSRIIPARAGFTSRRARH